MIKTWDRVKVAAKYSSYCGCTGVVKNIAPHTVLKIAFYVEFTGFEHDHYFEGKCLPFAEDELEVINDD